MENYTFIRKKKITQTVSHNITKHSSYLKRQGKKHWMLNVISVFKQIYCITKISISFILFQWSIFSRKKNTRKAKVMSWVTPRDPLVSGMALQLLPALPQATSSLSNTSEPEPHNILSLLHEHWRLI